MKFIVLTVLVFCAMQSYAQTDTARKKLPAVRTTQKIIIDGNLNDAAWNEAPLAGDFVEWRPNYGKKESFENRTEIRILYNNDAIYISGFCHEGVTDSISTELVGRDQVGVNDFVGVMFDTYNDKINGFGYYITPLGEQYDAKYSSNGEDGSWNSVFQSAAKLVSGGWVFEMSIPYSAIRFSKNKEQTWGLNITRRRRKSNQQFMWSPVDPTINNIFTQFGTWTNIVDIKPPLRLSFSPYLSTYVDNYPANSPATTATINGGMDVKYGINQAMTLDMTLVPDFGQVQSDNQVLNLTPFEVKFNENRTFFTEGTELFSKGNLFYSRRIGGAPLHQYNVKLAAGDSIIKNPSATKLINATKISGRTAKSLGIGIFNAVTQAEYATVRNNNSKEEFMAETSPLTNYNIIVLDKSMKHNSSISFINTNVWRSGSDYDANVTAGLWDLYDKKNTWNFYGKVASSQLIGYLPGNKTLGGYNHNVGFGKVSGRFTFQAWQELADDKFNPGDMGYYTNNNYMDHGAYVGYRWLKPNKWRNNMYFNFNFNYSQRFAPRSYQSVTANSNINGQFKNLWGYYVMASINAAEDDYYEPRVAGKVFKRPGSWNTGFYLSSNYAKKLAGEIGFFNRFFHTNNTTAVEYNLNLRYRFNTKLSVSINSVIEAKNNNYGFSTILKGNSNNKDTIAFALRRIRTVENVMVVKYNFNNKMGLNFRMRHYWSKVDNNQFLELNDDGSTSKIGNISKNPNSNVNFFNIDMVYTWQFSLGSFLNIGWKNIIEASNKDISNPYFKNFGNTLQSNQLNSFSVKVIYFLDYLNLKKHS